MLKTQFLFSSSSNQFYQLLANKQNTQIVQPTKNQFTNKSTKQKQQGIQVYQITRCIQISGPINQTYLFIYLVQKAKVMIQISQHPVYPPNFLDIQKTHHNFPEEINNIGFAVTLLHFHKHAPKDHFLTYKKDWKVAKYFPIETVIRDFYPCAWYLGQNGKIIPYQFATQKIAYEQAKIENDLNLLKKMGYKHYGITIKPVQSLCEVETLDGHLYIPKSMVIQGQRIETVTSGIKNDWCSVTQECINSTGWSHDRCSVHTYW